MSFKKRVKKSFTLALIAITILTPLCSTSLAMELDNALLNTDVKNMILTEKSDISLDEIIKNVNLNNEAWSNEFHEENKQERGLVTITTKVARKMLTKYKTKIITLLKKLPYGNKLSSLFTKHFDKLCSFLDKVSGGAEQAIYKFFRGLGFSHFWSDLIADGIITVIGWLL